MDDKTQKTVITILFVAFSIVAIMLMITISISRKRIETLKQTEQLYIVAQDSLKTTVNKLNQQTASILVLTSENDHLFTKIKSNDADIIRLQNVVKQYEKKFGNLNTAIIISNETIVHLQDSIRNLIIGWTSNPDTSNHYLYPTYKRAFNSTWQDGIIVMGLDTLDLQLKIRNEYNVTIGEEKVSLFKKKLYANVTNLNPSTQTKVMKVYQEKEVKTKIFKPLTIGSAIGIVVGYLLFH